MAVIGASDAPSSSVSTAERLGAAIAAEGWNLLCGGGSGVMEAACKGFAEHRSRSAEGGVSIGMLPGVDPAWGNAYLDVVLPTGMGLARNAVIARSALGVFAVGGQSGTLSEMAFAWQMGKPIVALTEAGGWGARLAGEALDDRRNDVVIAADTVEDAVRSMRDAVRGEWR